MRRDDVLQNALDAAVARAFRLDCLESVSQGDTDTELRWDRAGGPLKDPSHFTLQKEVMRRHFQLVYGI